MLDFWVKNKNSLSKYFKSKEIKHKRARVYQVFLSQKNMFLHLNPIFCSGKMLELYGNAGGLLKTYNTNPKVMKL